MLSAGVCETHPVPKQRSMDMNTPVVVWTEIPVTDLTAA